MIVVHEALNSNDYDLHLTIFDKGQMTLLDILNTSTTKLKIIKDTYIQTYSYNNGEPMGWTFMTYKWEPKQNKLSFKDASELIIDEDVYDFDMYFDAYKEVVDEWHAYPYAYEGFPHISLSADFVKEINKGRFLGEEIPLGEPIEAFIKENPDHLGTDYYEGGPFYNYPSGELYFFDEITEEINQFAYNGSSLQTTVAKFIELVGEPIEDTGTIDEDDPAYDYFIDNNHMMVFEFDKYNLTIEYEDDKILTIWINEQG